MYVGKAEKVVISCLILTKQNLCLNFLHPLLTSLLFSLLFWILGLYIRMMESYLSHAQTILWPFPNPFSDNFHTIIYISQYSWAYFSEIFMTLRSASWNMVKYISCGFRCFIYKCFDHETFIRHQVMLEVIAQNDFYSCERKMLVATVMMLFCHPVRELRVDSWLFASFLQKFHFSLEDRRLVIYVQFIFWVVGNVSFGQDCISIRAPKWLL